MLLGLKRRGIITSKTFGLMIQHLFQWAINSDQLSGRQCLILAIYRVAEKELGSHIGRVNILAAGRNR